MKSATPLLSGRVTLVCLRNGGGHDVRRNVEASSGQLAAQLVAAHTCSSVEDSLDGEAI